MINFVSILSSKIEEGYRKLKIKRLGEKDIQTPYEASPAGVDSVPIKDMVAIYSSTSTKGENVIIGYINKKQIAEPGEHRTFSLDENGEEQNYIWLKKNGDIEIGGDSDNMVRYSELETAFKLLQTELNAFISIFNAHVHVVTVPGLPNTPTVTPGIPSTADISAAKIDEIKTS